MTLVVKPLKLNKSMYFRVPNDIVDLIDLDAEDTARLNLQDDLAEFRLIYTIRKRVRPSNQPQTNPALITRESQSAKSH